MVKPNVVTYFESIDSGGNTIALSSSSYTLLQLWEDSWRRKGFNPIILNSKDFFLFSNEKLVDVDIEKHIEDPESKLYKFLPEDQVNSMGKDIIFKYTRECYRRHVAYANFALTHGEVIFADYDVINYGFTQNMFQTLNANTRLNAERSCVYYDEIGAFSFLNSFSTFIKNKKDTDLSWDMLVLERYEKETQLLRGLCATCREQGPHKDNYKTYPLVHFDGESYFLDKVKKEYGDSHISKIELVRFLRPISFPLSMF